MVIFSEKTVRIVRIDDLHYRRTPELHTHKQSFYRSSNNTEAKESTWKRNKNAWNYTTICFAKYDSAIDYYKRVIAHMIEFTKSNDALKYNITFQVLPAIARHVDSNNYIVLRIRTYNDQISHASKIVSDVLASFNEKYRNETFMAIENNILNVQYLQWLYAKEYTPFIKKKDVVKLQSKTISDDQIRYASISIVKDPPSPPMPKTLEFKFMIPPPGF